MIAVTHPGKIGDALYVLPTAQILANHYNCKIDFYTSDYCRPMVCLLECQPYINKVIIPEKYKIEKMDMGVQPWLMPTEGTYETIYQLGFNMVPDKPLPLFIAENAGIPKEIPLKIQYYFKSDIPEELKNKNYLVLAARGQTTFTETFLKFIDLCPLPIVIIGANGQHIDKGLDYTYLDFEQMTSVIAHSKGFVGLMSAPLVIANGFPIHKVIVHDGKSWDMRHIVHTEYTHYIVNPSSDQIYDYFKFI